MGIANFVPSDYSGNINGSILQKSKLFQKDGYMITLGGLDSGRSIWCVKKNTFSWKCCVYFTRKTGATA